MSAHRIIFSAAAIGAAAMLGCSGGTGSGVSGSATSQLHDPAAPGGTTTNASAGGGSVSSGIAAGSPSLSSGLGTFSGWLVDAPNPEVAEIHVTVTAVTVHLAGSGWIPLANGVTYPVSVDLLKLQDTAAALGFSALPPGNITQIRLLVSAAPDANYVVLKQAADPAHSKVPLKVPSGYESGIKILGPWRIAACTDTAVTLDFDGHKSIWYHPTGHADEWILRPVIRVREVSSTPITCPSPGGTSPGGAGLGGSCAVTADCSADLVCTKTPSSTGSAASDSRRSALVVADPLANRCSTPAPRPPPPPAQCLVKDGSACTTSTQCASASCASGICTSSGTPPPTPTPVPLGGSCQASTECAAGLACASGKCLVPDGNACSASAECVSSNCSSSICTAPVVTPAPIPLHGSCTADAECASGLCSSGQCLLPPGGQCTAAAACASGYCGATSGTCLAPVGGGCSYGAECSSGSCNAYTCAPGGAGARCLQGTECLSGTCGASGACSAGGAGAPCAVDGDCSIGACTSGRCLPATPLPISSACSSNAECQQGNCSDGTCQPGAQGAPCTAPAECQSGICGAGYCAGPTG